MTLEYFKQLVDKTPAAVPTELEEIYKYLDIPENGSYLTSVITDHIYNHIIEALSVNDEDEYFTLTKFLTLKDELVYREVLNDEPAKKYLEILNVIKDACRHKIKNVQSVSSQKQWGSAIQSAADYLKISPNAYLVFPTLREQHPKEYDRAVSMKKLRELGCKIELENDIINILGVENIYQKISNEVKKLGGLTLGKFIFDYLGKKAYSEVFERYKITRNVSTMEVDKEPQVPFGYLLNLCVKYPYYGKTPSNKKDEILSIIDLATITINAVYGAQPYSQWESIFLKGDNIVKFLINIALWDSMYSIPQCRPSTAVQIAVGIFNPLPDVTFERDFGFSRNEVKLFLQKINELVKNKKGPVVIDFFELDKKLYRIKRDKIETLLDSMSHIQLANEDYNEPADYLKIDFNFKPFIKTAKLKYILMDKSWCAPSYFEVIASKIRMSNKNLDQQLGHPIEDFLHDKFNEKGISVLSGDYQYKGEYGECDFLIETDKAIILIEAKKKVLTRKSKSGSDIEIVLDLSDSVIEAQRQAGRTSIVLLDSGSIELKQTDGSSSVVQLKGREIERIALTQLEYGGFQDRMAMEKFLMTLTTHTINTTSKDSRVINKMAKLAAKQQDLNEQYQKLCVLDSNFEHWPYRDCWFFSLAQMIEIINVSNDSETFYKALTENKYVSTGMMDWYTEYEYMMGMNQASTNVSE